jgi:hypothetical protein
MTRVISRLFALAALLAIVLGGGSVALAGKQRIAVLGIEVINNSGGVDTESTVIAHDLTEGLRTQAKTGTGTYTLAPNSDKELVDEKLLASCDDEAAGCMTKIGAKLDADVLMYGHIELITKGPNGPGYNVVINLLTVTKKGTGNVQTVKDFIPKPTGTTEDKLKIWAKRHYKKLTGQETGGTLVVKVTNVERGTVLIDEEEKGNLTSGTATLQLDEGRYKLAIEAEGYRHYEYSDPITIRPGETFTTNPIEMEKKSGGDTDREIDHTVTGTTSSSGSRGALKTVAATGLGVAAVTSAVIGYVYFVGPVHEYSSNNRKTVVVETFDPANPNNTQQITLESDSCGATFGPNSRQVTGDRQSFKDACLWTTRINHIMWPIVAVAGAVGAGTTIYLLATGSSGTAEHAGLSPRKRSIALTPVLDPQFAGATLRLDW